MREFMTKVSDYISERRNDPEKNGNFLIFCMLGIVILIIIILCLLLLWRKNTNGKKEEVTAETYEYIPEVVMAEPSNDEELKQEYLNNMEYLEEKVEDLLQFLTEIQKSLEETIITREGDNIYLQEQVDEITEDIKNMITQLQNTQNNLNDITDMINIMNKETIPVIQERISGMEKQINQVNIDITDIYNKIEALEITDTELEAKIDEIERKLKASIEQNMTDVTNRFTSMNIQIEQMTNQIQEQLQFMLEIQKSLEETVIEQEDVNTHLQEQLDEIREDVSNMIVRLQNTQNHLYDITDMVNIMNEETIPVIQEQINEMQKQMNQVNADISDIYGKIEALEISDEELKSKINDIEGKLKDKINDIEGKLKASIEQNMTDVTNQFDSVNTQIEQVINQMRDLSLQILQYRYDEKSNTLYLYSD